MNRADLEKLSKEIHHKGLLYKMARVNRYDLDFLKQQPEFQFWSSYTTPEYLLNRKEEGRIWDIRVCVE